MYSAGFQYPMRISAIALPANEVLCFVVELGSGREWSFLGLVVDWQRRVCRDCWLVDGCGIARSRGSLHFNIARVSTGGLRTNARAARLDEAACIGQGVTHNAAAIHNSVSWTYSTAKRADVHSPARDLDVAFPCVFLVRCLYLVAEFLEREEVSSRLRRLPSARQDQYCASSIPCTACMHSSSFQAGAEPFLRTGAVRPILHVEGREAVAAVRGLAPARACAIVACNENSRSRGKMRR
jgi:hypothetical protein